MRVAVIGGTGFIGRAVMSKARAMFGWVHADPGEAVRQSVRWHLEHPPKKPDTDFSPDDAALTTARDGA